MFGKHTASKKKKNEPQFRYGPHAVACAFHCIAVAYVAVTGKNFTVPVVWSWNVWNEDPTNENAVAITTHFEPVADSLTANVKIMVLLFSVISGFHHFVVLCSYCFGSLWYKQQAVEDGCNWVRWADYAFSSALMITVNTVLLKVPADAPTLVYVFLVQFLVCVGGGASEFAWSVERKNAAWLFFLAFSIPFVLLWASQFYWLARAGEHSKTVSDEGMPIFVYLYFAFLLGGFCIFPLVHGSKLLADPTKSAAKKAACINAENRYTAASLIAKVPLLLLYAVSLQNESFEYSPEATTSNATKYNEIAADNTLYATAFGSLTLCIFVGFLLLYCKC
jgi:hypothetical protein